jgi:hypothetical protein
VVGVSKISDFSDLVGRQAKDIIGDFQEQLVGRQETFEGDLDGIARVSHLDVQFKLVSWKFHKKT